jgi:hypothetical protein
MAIIEQRPEIEALALAIARSPIVVEQTAERRRLPHDLADISFEDISFEDISFEDMGFEDVDLAILGWIAEEGRRVGRGLIRV